MDRGLPLGAALVFVCVVASFTSLPHVAGTPDRAGGPRPEAVAGSPMDPLDASLSLSLFSNVSVVDPGDLAWLVGEAANSGTEPATNVTLEASLDPDTSYIQSFPAALYDPANRTLRWTFGSVADGSNVNVFWQIQVAVGTPDNTFTTSRLGASYANASGAPKPPEEVTTQIRVRAPVFSPVMGPTPAAAQRGEIVVVRLYINNTGSATALRAWSNWTLGGHFRFLALEESFPVTNVTDGFQIALTNLAPGPHVLTAHLEVLRALDDGLRMAIQSQWTATDGNGNLLVPSSAGNAVTLLAPRFTIALNASSLQVNTTSRFVLTVTLRNTGRAAGIGWLNLTLPSGPSFVSDNASFPRSNQGKRYTWTLPSVPAGGALVVGLAFDASSDPRVASFVFTVQFSDDTGSPAATGPSPRIDVEFVDPTTVGGPAPLLSSPWIWAVLASVAGGLAAFFVWRRQRASELQIEDVFVADMGGHLLAHRSSGLVAYEDEDILIGMFKVIQDFVKDSFARGTNDTMKSMEFGERKIIIERGRYHFISVVYRGLDRGSLGERVRKVSRLIDQRFGQALENWSGDLDELRGLATLLPLVWKHQPRVRAPPGPDGAPASGAGRPAEDGSRAAGEQAPAESSTAEVAADPPK